MSRAILLASVSIGLVIRPPCPSPVSRTWMCRREIGRQRGEDNHEVATGARCLDLGASEVEVVDVDTHVGWRHTRWTPPVKAVRWMAVTILPQLSKWNELYCDLQVCSIAVHFGVPLNAHELQELLVPR